jgi:hypothetical protein
MKQFHLMPFIFGIITGFILLYIFDSKKQSITQYPKINDTQEYKDKNGNTYIYETKEVNCDDNEKELELYPVS